MTMVSGLTSSSSDRLLQPNKHKCRVNLLLKAGADEVILSVVFILFHLGAFYLSLLASSWCHQLANCMSKGGAVRPGLSDVS